MVGAESQLSETLLNIKANRPDIYGKEAAEQLELQKSKNPEQPKIIWDGQSSSISRTTANAVMMAHQQRKNLEETIKNQG